MQTSMTSREEVTALPTVHKDVELPARRGQDAATIPPPDTRCDRQVRRSSSVYCPFLLFAMSAHPCPLYHFKTGAPPSPAGPALRPARPQGAVPTPWQPHAPQRLLRTRDDGVDADASRRVRRATTSAAGDASGTGAARLARPGSLSPLPTTTGDLAGRGSHRRASVQLLRRREV